jgi:hypothetical protein
MKPYAPPMVSTLGSLHDLTLSTINKTGTSGDVLVINGQTESIPGSSVTSVS